MTSNQNADVTAALDGLRLTPGVTIVKSADEDSGKSFIALVESLCSSSNNNANNRVAFDCEG